jgi:hypothetical protein
MLPAAMLHAACGLCCCCSRASHHPSAAATTLHRQLGSCSTAVRSNAHGQQPPEPRRLHQGSTRTMPTSTCTHCCSACCLPQGARLVYDNLLKRFLPRYEHKVDLCLERLGAVLVSGRALPACVCHTQTGPLACCLSAGPACCMHACMRACMAAATPRVTSLPHVCHFHCTSANLHSSQLLPTPLLPRRHSSMQCTRCQWMRAWPWALRHGCSW